MVDMILLAVLAAFGAYVGWLIAAAARSDRRNHKERGPGRWGER